MEKPNPMIQPAIKSSFGGLGCPAVLEVAAIDKHDMESDTAELQPASASGRRGTFKTKHRSDSLIHNVRNQLNLEDDGHKKIQHKSRYYGKILALLYDLILKLNFFLAANFQPRTGEKGD